MTSAQDRPPEGEHQQSIRNLLQRMNRFSIALATIVATFVIIFQEGITLQNMSASEFLAQTRIVGNNCTAALAFSDSRAATDVLASLKNVPHILQTEIIDKDGAVFARYRSDSAPADLASDAFTFPEHRGIRFGWRRITLEEPIILRGEQLGYTRSVYDVVWMLTRIAEFALELILIGIATIILASYLFSRKLDAISEPMRELAGTMQAITHDKDYSRRVPVAGPAEVFSLAEGFNALLVTTEEWNTEILAHRENLEQLVDVRTKLWQKANQGLEAELEERRRTERELRIKTEELARVSENLASSLEFEKHFLANISHEIRTPLSAVIGFSDFVLKTPLNAKQFEYINKIRTAGRSLVGIINDLLDFSKIEAGKLGMEKIAFDLDDVVGEAIDIVSHRIHEKGLEFSLEIAADLPGCFIGDPIRLRQILINLLGNAVKFTETGEIGLRIDQSEQSGESTRLLFTVQDTGIGMSPEQISRLFIPFTQGDGSMNRRFGGTGLGLSISKHLIEMMGGEITASSKLHQGSLFRFSIFLTPGKTETAPKQFVPAILNDLRVMLVDDRSSIRPPLIRTLRRLPVRLQLVHSISDAMSGLRENDANDPFRLIVLDAKEFDTRHSGFIESVKAHHDLTHTPAIIAIQSRSNQELRSRLVALGCNEILDNPVTGSAMFDAIVQIFAPEEISALRLGKPGAGDEISFSGLRALVAEDNEFNQEIARELLDARFDVDAGLLHLVVCSETPFLRFRSSDKSCEEFHSKHDPHGPSNFETCLVRQITIEPGDLFLFFSDGMINALNPQGESFGLRRLEEFVRAHQDKAPQQLLSSLETALHAFIQAEKFSDNVTAIAIRLAPKAAGS